MGQNIPFTDWTEIYEKLLDVFVGEFVELCLFNGRPAISSVAFQNLRLRVLLQGTLSVVFMARANADGIFYSSQQSIIFFPDVFSH